ncbi:sel-10 [Symbiodinium pilosum]|uniref:Sel-10 protein n=1 Tax=Symbiodinium pilosum TaxID=2952 RepID=A0A812W8N7_SYMPI|nr:sel-10 [Symbiodinium pilosum]
MADGASRMQWDISAKCTDDELHRKKLPILCVSFNGETVLTSSSKSTVKLWKVGDGLSAQGSLAGLAGGAAAPSSLDSFKDRACVCTLDGQILLWDLRNPQEPPNQLDMTLTTQGGLIRFLPDGNRLVTGGISGKLVVWDLRQGRIEREIAPYAPRNGNAEERPSKIRRISAVPYGGPITALGASPDGQMLACGRSSGGFRGLAFGV